jgi:hypothetical protein
MCVVRLKGEKVKESSTQISHFFDVWLAVNGVMIIIQTDGVEHSNGVTCD